MKRVHLFIPCFIDQLFPQTAFNTVKVLRKAGCEVIYNAEQTCCGQPAFNAGFWEEARPVCEKFIHDMEDADYVVGPSGSCVGFVRNYYPLLFQNSALHNECRQLGRRLYELSEFLVDVLQVTDFGARLHGVATYHDACGALRECGIRDAPRRLLSRVEGLELREMQDRDSCCGFGGTFAVKFDEISAAMAYQKMQQVALTEAQYLISTDYSCLMHLDSYFKKQESKVQVMHLADVLASGW
ncbi:MAG: (Fe-S)-binding protein [Chitinophagales bacterium]|nr:(Fe-S)-binding protein [Chitinophagales bacterium]MDW8427404.1 (Fe-S)-binding protein [Chitinophagales bacterium]